MAVTVGLAIGQAIGTAIGGGIIGSIVGMIAGNLIGGALTSIFGSGPDRQAQPQQNYAGANLDNGIRVNTAQTNEPVPVIYGIRRVGCSFALRRHSGAGNTYMDVVAVLGEGEIEGVDMLYIDGVAYTDARFTGLVTVEYVNGTDAQAALASLVANQSTVWTARHTLSGVAYAYIRLTYNSTAFPNGFPLFEFDVRGRKVYDPRDGVTRFSNNPALIVRDWMTNSRYGRGLPASAMNDTAFGAEADYCDGREAVPARDVVIDSVDPAANTVTFAAEDVFDWADGVNLTSTGAVPGGLSSGVTVYVIRVTLRAYQLASTPRNALLKTPIDLTSAGSGVITMHHVDQTRYTCDGRMDVDADWLENFNKLRSSGRFWVPFTAGKYKPVGDRPAASTFDFTTDNIVGQWTIDVGGKDGRYNRVIAHYINPVDNWKPDVAIADNPSERSADGGSLLQADLALETTQTNKYRVQRIGQIERRKSRLGIKVRHTATIGAGKCEVGDVVTHTHPTPGWSGKLFRVMNIDLLSSNEVAVDLWEYSAAVWTLDAQAAMVVPVRTALPDPALVGVPGTPSIAEEIYETTGSAGVKSRAVVMWAAANDAFVAGYEAQYKVAGDPDSAYQSLAPVSLLTARAEDVAPGLYAFRARAVSIASAVSAWTPVTVKELLGLTVAPAAVTGFSVVNTSGIGIAQWAAHPDLDVKLGGKIVIRWTPTLGGGASWGNTIVYDEFDGNLVSGIVPLKTGTYFAKALDSTGHYSDAAVSFAVTEGMITGLTTVSTITEHAAFSGTKSNVALVGSAIQLDSASTIDSMAANVDSWPNIDSLGGVSATGSYSFAATFDGGTVLTRRYESVIRATQFDTGDLIDARTDLIDDWGLFDGALVEDCDAQLYARTTPDDPAGSPVWSAWTPFYVADFNARAAQFRLDLASGSATHNISIDQLQVLVKVPT